MSAKTVDGALRPGDMIKVADDKDAKEYLKALSEMGYNAARVSGNYIRITRSPEGGAKT